MLFQETYKFINGKDHKNWVDRKRKESISSPLKQAKPPLLKNMLISS